MNLFGTFSFPDNWLFCSATAAAATGQSPAGAAAANDYGALLYSGIVTAVVIVLVLLYSRWSFKKMRRMNNTRPKRCSSTGMNGALWNTKSDDSSCKGTW